MLTLSPGLGARPPQSSAEPLPHTSYQKGNRNMMALERMVMLLADGSGRYIRNGYRLESGAVCNATALTTIGTPWKATWEFVRKTFSTGLQYDRLISTGWVSWDQLCTGSPILNYFIGTKMSTLKPFLCFPS